MKRGVKPYKASSFKPKINKNKTSCKPKINKLLLKYIYLRI